MKGQLHITRQITTLVMSEYEKHSLNTFVRSNEVGMLTKVLRYLPRRYGP
jgi:hypothetical protein